MLWYYALQFWYCEMTQIYVYATMNEYSMHKGQGCCSAFFTTVLLTHLHMWGLAFYSHVTNTCISLRGKLWANIGACSLTLPWAVMYMCESVLNFASLPTIFRLGFCIVLMMMYIFLCINICISILICLTFQLVVLQEHT